MRLTDLKTDGSIRDLDVGTFAHNRIIEYIKYLETLSAYNDKYFLCGSIVPLPKSPFTRWKDKYILKLEITPRIKIHEFRHTHATMLINAGVPLIEVSRRLGHQSTAITEKTYVHYLQKHNEILINSLDLLQKR